MFRKKNGEKGWGERERGRARPREGEREDGEGENDKANIGKNLTVGNMNTGYMGVICTLLSTFLKILNDLKIIEIKRKK